MIHWFFETFTNPTLLTLYKFAPLSISGPIMSPWRTHKILKMFTAAKSFCSTTIAAILIAMTLTLTVSPATTLAATSPKPDHMPPVTQCKMSEHTCTNGKCVPLNKYCNNVNDCGDGSDEPRFCTREQTFTFFHNYLNVTGGSASIIITNFFHRMQ